MTRFPLAAMLALALALAPALVQGADLPPAPEGVAVVDAGDAALVSWTPSADAAARHNVYGLRDGALVLLGSTLGGISSFAAQGGFESYGVSVVLDGEESEVAFPCILIRTHRMPPLNIRLDCLPRPPRDVHVILPVLP